MGHREKISNCEFRISNFETGNPPEGRESVGSKYQIPKSLNFLIPHLRSAICNLKSTICPLSSVLHLLQQMTAKRLDLMTAQPYDTMLLFLVSSFFLPAAGCSLPAVLCLDHLGVA